MTLIIRVTFGPKVAPVETNKAKTEFIQISQAVLIRIICVTLWHSN